jgi:hypothetical protein
VSDIWVLESRAQLVEGAVPRAFFERGNYGDISVTVLGPVHAGDSRPSVLLGVPRRLWMTAGRVVWFVCSDWGSTAVVHGRSGRGMSVSILRTAVCTGWAVTGVMGGSKVF